MGNTDYDQAPISWAKRIKLYNSHVVGNQELLSISSYDTTWEEGSGEGEEEEEEEKGDGAGQWKLSDDVDDIKKAGKVD